MNKVWQEMTGRGQAAEGRSPGAESSGSRTQDGERSGLAVVRTLKETEQFRVTSRDCSQGVWGPDQEA